MLSSWVRLSWRLTDFERSLIFSVLNRIILYHNITKHCCLSIGVDLAGLLGGRMASAEGGSVPSGVGYGKECPLSSRLRGLGSVVSSPAGSRAEPRPKTDFGVFWRPQNAHFCTYMTKSGGTICISVPRSKFWGGLVSPLSPVIYAHANTDIFIHRKTVAHNISKRIITPHSRKKQP